ncbi:MAG TPA: hypothetical protein VHH90_04470 [Polyangia bacterium]|nr:hypothetical protein [Polyangia bacterium]
MPSNRPGEERPFAGSLCWRCVHHRAITAPRSVFLLCNALPVKYPPQPVLACPLFRPRPATS